MLSAALQVHGPVADLTFEWSFFWDALLRPQPTFLGGLVRTIYLSVVAQVLAVVIGLFIALANRSRWLPLRAFASGWIWLLRGTPLLVQLVIVYNGFAALGLFQFNDVVVLGGFRLAGVIQAAILTLAVNESAYMAEIIRAGIDSVGRGQTEAALSLGMTPARAMRHIVLPQAARFVVPPLGNNFNAMMKSTSILSIIGVQEMFLVAQSVSSTTFRTFEIFLVAALYYLLLTTVWTVIQAWIEARIGARGAVERPPSPLQRLFGGQLASQLGERVGAGRARDAL